ncbi:7202_t:CDS:2 [Diversispora eburnea]|uniref:Ribonuclease n=1 Tax=Diversispora eburnea TaxID=1213867 RepID=A0A9N9BV93_9GLOM|nr:7202_t:CDS:2 [Diversispora eburnea]
MESNIKRNGNILHQDLQAKCMKDFTIPSLRDGPLTESYTYHSPLPSLLTANKNEPCILGIDEAGRGPVLDSKTLKESDRETYFKIIQSQQDCIAWSVRVISPQDISWNMLKRDKYNLNAQAHDTTIQLIQEILDRGVNVNEIYVDTVGPPESYQVKLSRIFNGINITVAKKADSLYPIVSAASICAKVTRDHVLKNWIFAEKNLNLNNSFGSGYPSDPNTVNWLKENTDDVFGFPRIIRFSWATCETILKKDTFPVIWPEEETSSQDPITRFFTKDEKEKPFSKLLQEMKINYVSEF